MNMELYKYIEKTKNVKFQSYTELETIVDDEKEYRFAFPTQAKYILLNFNNEQLIFRNVYTEIIIPKVSTDRMITLIFEESEVKLLLKDFYLECNKIGTDDNFYISIDQKKFERDVLIKSPEELYDYPIFDISLQTIDSVRHTYKGSLKMIVSPFNDSIDIITLEDEYYKVFNQLSYYKEKLLELSDDIIKLVIANPKELLVVINGVLYKYIGFDSDTKSFQLFTYDSKDDSQSYSLTFENLIKLYDSNIYLLLNIDSIINYNGKWITFKNHDTAEENEKMLGHNYKESIFYKLDNLSKLIVDNYANNNKEIAKELYNTYIDFYKQFEESELFDKEIVYKDKNNDLFYHIDKDKEVLKNQFVQLQFLINKINEEKD